MMTAVQISSYCSGLNSILSCCTDETILYRAVIRNCILYGRRFFLVYNLVIILLVYGFILYSYARETIKICFENR